MNLHRYQVWPTTEGTPLVSVTCNDCKDRDGLPDYVYRGSGPLLNLLGAITRHEEKHNPFRV